MGNLQAQEFASMVEDEGLDLTTALEWHLTANHFPPLPLELVPVAVKVIDLANQEDWDAEVELPEGVTYKDRGTAPVYACVEAWHLDAFLEGGE